MDNRHRKINESDPFDLFDLADQMAGVKPEPQIVERVVEVEKIVEVPVEVEKRVEVEVTAPVETDQHGVTWVGTVGLSPTGLVIPQGGISKEEWAALFDVISNIRTSWQFIIGDWFVYGNDQLKYTSEQIAEWTGYKVSSIESFASVCRNVPRLTRVKTLSFAHHRRVSKLSPERQIMALGVAEANQYTVREFRAYLSGNKRKRLSSGQPRKRSYNVIDKNELRRLKNADKNERRKAAERLRRIADELEG